jgi:hypothetical protein
VRGIYTHTTAAMRTAMITALELTWQQAAARAGHGAGRASADDGPLRWGRDDPGGARCGRAMIVGHGFLGLADTGEDPVVITGYRATKKRKLTTGQKTANKVISAARAAVEHGFAHLKAWRVLTKLRTDPARATNPLRALLVLTNLELER